MHKSEKTCKNLKLSLAQMSKSCYDESVVKDERCRNLIKEFKEELKTC